MLRRWKKSIEQFAYDKPGERFTNQYKRQREKGTEKTPLYIVLGILLIIMGTLLSIPPLFPGFIITLAGLSLLAGQLKYFSKGLDKGELFFRRRFMKSKKGNASKE